MRDADVEKRVVRLAWALHGREMVNNAGSRAEKKGEAEAEKARKMVETGAWYIRASAEGGEQAVGQEEWLRRLVQ